LRQRKQEDGRQFDQERRAESDRQREWQRRRDDDQRRTQEEQRLVEQRRQAEEQRRLAERQNQLQRRPNDEQRRILDEQRRAQERSRRNSAGTGNVTTIGATVSRIAGPGTTTIGTASGRISSGMIGDARRTGLAATSESNFAAVKTIGNVPGNNAHSTCNRCVA
jgi:hypothetical protein